MVASTDGTASASAQGQSRVAQSPDCCRPVTALSRGEKVVSVVVRIAVLSVSARARVTPTGTSNTIRTARLARRRGSTLLAGIFVTSQTWQ